MWAKHTTVLALTVMLAQAGVALPVTAQEEFPPPVPGTSLIRGKVRLASDNSAVGGAIVRVHHLDGERMFESAPTAANGQFEITGIPFGYVDISIETADGLYAATQVINVPPDGKVTVSFLLESFDERPETWWSANRPREVPGLGREATGVAELQQGKKGAAFWKSAGGIAIIAGGAALIVLAIANSGGDDASPSNP